MKITDLLSVSTIDLKVKAVDKTDVLKQAVKLVSASGNIEDVETYQTGVFNREKESTTGVGDGIAIPHCKSTAVKKPTLAAMVIPEGVDFASLDGAPVNVLFLIAAPVSKDNVHLDVLAKLSNLLMHPEFKDNLMKAQTPEEFMKIIDNAELSSEQAEAAKDSGTTYPKILAVTACPTGIAHTYMAEESLIKTAKEMGISIKVETNGQSGVKHRLTDEEIAHAEGIIVACDINVEMTRFNGHRVLQCAVAKAINKPKELIEKSLDKNLPIFNDGKTKVAGEASAPTSGNKFSFRTIYKHLMAGISHMIPVVVASGILLALSFFIDSCCGFAGAEGFGTNNPFAHILNDIGGFGLGTLMLPILAGFIAYSIAGRAGLAAGFIGGMCASKGTFSLLYIIEVAINGTESELAKQLSTTAAGFLGAIVAGFLAGYVMIFLQQKAFAKLPKALNGVKAIFLQPVCSVAIVGLAMVLINVPLAYINIGISLGLSQMLDKNLIYILAFLVAALMATDMGGPINKASHYFCYYLITNFKPGDQLYMFGLIVNAAHVVGIMVPPMACALCTWLFPQKFKKADRMTAPADMLTGFCGITEGAIPYVAKDPIRVIVSCMLGAGVGGVVCCWGGLGCVSAEGGIFSMVVGTGTIGITLLWGLMALAVGVVLAAIVMGLLKKDVKVEEAELKKWKGIPTQPVYNAFAKVGHAIAKPFKKKKETK